MNQTNISVQVGEDEYIILPGRVINQYWAAADSGSVRMPWLIIHYPTGMSAMRVTTLNIAMDVVKLLMDFKEDWSAPQNLNIGGDIGAKLRFMEIEGKLEAYR